MGTQCDFTEEPMRKIGRWWCLVLLHNFPMPSDYRIERRREQNLLNKDDMEVPPTKAQCEDVIYINHK
ncbi:hypothetical protein AALO_G00058780 [Alosa alosa]|uniref:Uncharacterized protein n=1 Tax=Alosa alosa TaxID=278164 RepID=A0AAV6H6I3_9TELE|nr:hypothetical protein AALO_G00058780 [Alosa alosa]